MRIASFILVGFFLGGFVGYMAGILIFCMLLDPDKPQCGLVAAFITGPAGAVLGAILGLILSFRKNASCCHPGSESQGTKARLAQPLLGLAFALAFAALFVCGAVRDGLVIQWVAAGYSSLGAILFLVRTVALLRTKPPLQDRSTEATTEDPREQSP